MSRRSDVRTIETAAAIVELAGGRRLGFATFGAPDGRPVIALHGTPGSRLKFAGMDGRARELGLRLVCPDRWAYGASDPHPAPSLAAFGADVAGLADALGLARLSLLGVSGGGPYAAAAAAVLSNRVQRLALVCPVGPMRGLSWNGIGLFHRLAFGGLARLPGGPERVFAAYRAVVRRSPGLALRIAGLRAPADDRRLLGEADVRRHLASAFRVGLATSAAGPALDLTLFGRAWDVPLGAVSAQSRVWLGSADRNVPNAAARRLAEAIPGAGVEMLPGRGHFWITRDFEPVLTWLAACG